MTLEEKFQPTELDRLRVENEVLRENARKLAAYAVIEIASRGDIEHMLRSAFFLQHLMPIAFEIQPIEMKGITINTLCLAEAVLTPDNNSLRTRIRKYEEKKS